ncbi:MAG: type VI secretion system baseplate subunit TssK [Rhodothermales bacterium]
MPVDRKRVVWFEGMTLDPHHFQQWDRYNQGVLNARIRALAGFDWGVSQLEIDRERLANGELVIVRGKGSMPDGLTFDMPESDEVPTPRNVQDYFPPTADRLAVFLATPVERQDGGNFLLQGAENRRQTRFHSESIFVPDENTGADARKVEVARANFQIRFGGEPVQEYTTIQVAEVLRTSAGVFVLNEQFVPTCLSVTASERLLALTRRLLELLVSQSTSLADRQHSVTKLRELSPADILALGLLGTINTYIPLLNHHLAHAESHPEALYLTLQSLAGQLTAWLPDAGVHPRNFPSYDHADLTGCFNRLDQILLDMLGGARVEANYIEIPLQLQRENLYTASIDAELLQSAQFFLVARSQEFSEGQLITELPKNLRIASPETIEAVLRGVIRALPIEHTHRIPSALPVDQQANYFLLRKTGPFWEAICDSGGVAVFVPTEISTVDLKLIAVLSP